MRALKWVLVALLVLIAAAVVLVLTIDVNRFKPQIVAAVENATGRKLEIVGNLGLSVFPSPALTVKEVTFANAPWGSRPAMATIGEFDVEVDLLPLLRQQIKIDRLVLANVDLLLEKNAQGQANWEFSSPASQPASREAKPAAASQPNDLPVVSDLLLKNVKVAFRDAQSGATADVNLKELAVEQTNSGVLAAQLIAVVNGNDLEVNGTLGSLAELTAPSQPWPIKLNITGPGARAQIDGTIAQPLQAKGIALTVGADIPDLAKLAGTFGASAPSLPVKLQTQVKDTGPQRYQLTGLTANIGPNDLAGSGEIALGGPRPMLRFDLTSKSFDVATLLGPASKAAAESKPAGTATPGAGAGGGRNGTDGRLFSDEPLPLDGLNAVDAVLAYKAERFKAPMIEAQNLAVNVALKDGVLNAKPQAENIAGGRLAGDVTLSGKAKTLTAKLDGAGIVLSDYLQKNGITDVVRRGAPADLAVDVKSQGGSLRQIMGNLNGSAVLKVGEGELKEEYVRSFMPDLARAVGVFDRATAKTKLHCVVSGLDIRNGVATPKALLAETGSLTLAGDGNVNLGTEQLNLRLAVTSRDTSLAGALPPVRVRGTLANPSFSPDSEALVKGALGAAAGAAALGPLGVLAPLLGAQQGGGGNPDEAAKAACTRAIALAEGRQVPQTAPTQQTQPQSQQPQQPSGNPLEDLRKGLGGLLRR